jgi:tetratricopeptide (TPR) repeat protein
MKSIYIGLCILVCNALTVLSQDSANLTATEWQEDLAFLSETIHAEYPFLFKKISAPAFDAAVSKLHAEIPKLQPHEIMVGLARLVASFKYGHTVLGYWEGKIPYRQVPLVLYQYDDGIYLQGVHRDYEALAGSRLTAIEGVPIDTVLSKMAPVVPAENDMFTKAYGIHYLTFPEFLHAQGIMPELKGELKLSLENNGQAFETTVKAVPSERFPRQYGMVVPGADWVESRDLSQTPLYLKDLDKIYYYQYLPESKTVYVRHSQIQDDAQQNIPAFYAEVFEFIENNEVDKLILDVRLNGGGNNYKNKPIVTGIIRSEKINQPGRFMVIIGRRTFSACQNLVNELHNYTHAVFVGEPTAENINFFGDNRPVTLPNSGINAYLSFAWWQDKPQWENAPWLVPQIATGMTFEQYRTNEDPALEAALAFNDTTYVSDPMGYLTELFTRGEIEKVKTEALRMISDPTYAYFEFEKEFDAVAGKLLGDQRIDEAFFVAQMNAQYFPDSPGVWLRMGELYLQKENREGARTALEKTLELDPTGPSGEQARKMLATF